MISLKNYGRQDQDIWEPTDLREGIRDTLTVLNNRLKHYAVRLQLDPIPITRRNAGEMNQVWTNLITNACQATPEGGTITISTATPPDESALFITVTDSGIGIPPDHLEQIFETNFTTKTSKSEFGLGLGLAISKEIIAKHDGRITAENMTNGGAHIVRIPARN